MVFKRLLGRGGIPLEIDTIVQSEPARPGGLLTGEVVVRAPERDIEVGSVTLRLTANAPLFHKGDGDGEQEGDRFDYVSASGYFTLKKGGERRIHFRHRVKWETPLSELDGQELKGALLTLHTEVDAEGIKSQTDNDVVRVTGTPLHQAVFDAFSAAGYDCDTSRIFTGTIPRTEYHVYAVQGFLLTDRTHDGQRPRELELTFHANAVGAEIFLRASSLRTKYWKEKSPALRYVAAHHDVGHTDFEAAALRWISEVTALGDAPGWCPEGEDDKQS
ncbi:sporulation protein [Streptomyces sp. NPDC059534]|uniref:sporulation protein n=1 Tax=Streptomyces sp. NPDC059534 TaxID=3346859 RepID=UPI00369D02B6